MACGVRRQISIDVQCLHLLKLTYHFDFLMLSVNNLFFFPARVWWVFLVCSSDKFAYMAKLERYVKLRNICLEYPNWMSGPVSAFSDEVSYILRRLRSQTKVHGHMSAYSQNNSYVTQKSLTWLQDFLWLQSQFTSPLSDHHQLSSFIIIVHHLSLNILNKIISSILVPILFFFLFWVQHV